MEKVVGIVGGMGPEATVDLFRKIVEATPAEKDQDHLHMLVDCNSKIPSRGGALLRGTEDPTPALQATARNLEGAGAGFLVIASNTGHLFYDKVVEAVSISILHIVEETLSEVKRSYPAVRRVGILGSDSTIRLRLYQDRLEAAALEVLVPEPLEQEVVEQVIRRVKAGDKGDATRADVREVAERLAGRGAELVLAACTELPLILAEGDLSVPLLDPTRVLAEAAVKFARSQGT